MELLGIKHYSQSHHSNNFPNYVSFKRPFLLLFTFSSPLAELNSLDFLFFGIFWAPTMCKERRAQGL